MELHRNTANVFIDYLKKHGYPEDSIVTEWKIGKYRVDIAILDKARALPVAIYEIKDAKTDHSISIGLIQLERYINSIGYPVEAGLVFSKTTPPFFEFINVTGRLNRTKDNHESINDFKSDIEPLSYENLRNSAEPKFQYSIKKKKEQKLDSFSKICWGLASLTFVLFMLENFGEFAYTTERLIVFGVFLVLIILPYYSEIKLGDASFKRDSKIVKKE